MKEITEGNKIIAKFMGATVTQSYSENKDYEQDGFLFYYPERSSPSIYRNMSSNSIKYHSSWDWLMPVVEKIHKVGFYYKLTDWQFFICRYNDYSGVIAYDSKTDIDEPEIYRVFKTVIQFITWYNNQNKQS